MAKLPSITILRPTRSLFFAHFPKIEYAFLGEAAEKQVTNIITAFYMSLVPAYKSFIFMSYTLTDTDTYESLAEDLYKNYQYYWTPLIVNGIIDPYFEWAISHDVMTDFVAKKYEDGVQIEKANGTTETLLLSEGVYGIHHFINTDLNNLRVSELEDRELRVMYDADPTSIGDNISPVTNLTYESEENLKRREIQVVNPRAIYAFISAYEDMIEGEET